MEVEYTVLVVYPVGRGDDGVVVGFPPLASDTGHTVVSKS